MRIRQQPHRDPVRPLRDLHRVALVARHAGRAVEVDHEPAGRGVGAQRLKRGKLARVPARHDPPPELRLFPSPEFAPALLWLFDVLVLLVFVLDELVDVDVDVLPLFVPLLGPTVVDVPLFAPELAPMVLVPLPAPEFAPTVDVPLPAPLLAPTVVFVVDTGAVVVVVVGDVVVVTGPVLVTGPVVVTAPLPFRASKPRTAT